MILTWFLAWFIGFCCGILSVVIAVGVVELISSRRAGIGDTDE